MTALVCRQTGTRYPADEPRWRSDACGLLDLDFEPRFDLDRVRARPPTMWRYREALPIDRDENVVSLGEGFTPLVPFGVAGRRVLLKLEQLSPTGSFKDRGASVLISKVKELGVSRVIEDSSGNAGAAAGAYCARAGISCEIYAPASATPAKLAQIEMYGARLHAITGARENVTAAAWEAAQSNYYASHVWNPYFVHGTKTFAYEIVEQLDWQPPDAVLTPVGNGTLLCGAYLGFCELRAAGVIDRLPRLIGAQAGRCAPLATAWASGQLPGQPVTGPTLADGISIAKPLRAEQCLEAVRATGGEFIAVGEADILNALRTLARGGILAEPTSAAAVAALPQYAGAGTIVVAITGHGLKAGGRLPEFANG